MGAQDDIEPVDTSDELINGSRVGGPLVPAAGGSCPVPTPENVDGVAKPAESSAIGSRLEYPPLMRESAETNAKKGSEVPVPAIPHL